MTKSESAQLKLFNDIKSRLPAYISLVDEVSTLLDLSADSAYRRIRGEKLLTMEELCVLCQKYQISLDAYLNISSGIILFKGNLVQPGTFRFDAYLQNMLGVLKNANSFSNRKMYYLAKDIPPFHHYQFPLIAAFKIFFWMKSLFQFPEFLTVKFKEGIIDDHLLEIGKQIYLEYIKIPSTEIWNAETINSTIRQINVYNDMGEFENHSVYNLLLDTLHEEINHFEKETDAGYKYYYGKEMKGVNNTFNIYVNEVILGDNTILFQSDESRKVFISHNILNYLGTSDSDFCNYTHNSLHNLMKKSTLISGTGEKERKMFFNSLRNRIRPVLV